VLKTSRSLAIGVRLVAAGLLASLAASCAAPPPTGRFADPSYGIERSNDLGYGTATDENGEPEQLRLDLFRPINADGPRPAIVFIHSGAFTGGVKSEQDSMATDFAARGYVTATITYRVREGAWIWFNTPSGIALDAARDARHDAQAAVRYLRANSDLYGIDAGRIAAAGYSAGAITAIGVGQHPEDPGNSGNAGPSSAVCLAVSLSGIAVEGEIEADDADIVMFHGGDDFIVPTAYARGSAMRAAKAGHLLGYHEFPGVGHGLPYQRTPEIMPTLIKVLRDRLANGAPCA